MLRIVNYLEVHSPALRRAENPTSRGVALIDCWLERGGVALHWLASTGTKPPVDITLRPSDGRLQGLQLVLQDEIVSEGILYDKLVEIADPNLISVVLQNILHPDTISAESATSGSFSEDEQVAHQFAEIYKRNSRHPSLQGCRETTERAQLPTVRKHDRQSQARWDGRRSSIAPRPLTPVSLCESVAECSLGGRGEVSGRLFMVRYHLLVSLYLI